MEHNDRRERAITLWLCKIRWKAASGGRFWVFSPLTSPLFLELAKRASRTVEFNLRDHGSSRTRWLDWLTPSVAREDHPKRDEG
jgi:hypothetical protein